MVQRALLEMSNPRFSEIAEWFQAMSPQSLRAIDTVYAEDTTFIDPFNHLNGIGAVRAVYQHMFDTLVRPRFVVTMTVAQGGRGFMTWDFLFEVRGRELRIEGCTQFELNAEGLIVLHRDYWDPSQQLYEKIPFLGGVLRHLRRKLALPG
jgi:steroid Delta-isomerase